MSSDPNLEEIGNLFHLALLKDTVDQQKATGGSADDFIYRQAESVRRSKEVPTYVYVTLRGTEYLAFMSWGPLDGDHGKYTALIQANDDKKWYKLWFFE